MTVDSKQEITVSQKPAGTVGEGGKLHKPAPFTPFDEVERLFERLMPTSWIRPMNWNWPLWGTLDESFEHIRVPQLDIVDHDKEIVIRVEMPGVDKKDIQVSLNNSTLNISGSVSHEAREQRKDYVRCEITHGNFSRSLAIPDGVDTTKIGASLRDGILEITLPKEPATQRRAVEVK